MCQLYGLTSSFQHRTCTHKVGLVAMGFCQGGQAIIVAVCCFLCWGCHGSTAVVVIENDVQ